MLRAEREDDVGQKYLALKYGHWYLVYMGTYGRLPLAVTQRLPGTCGPRVCPVVLKVPAGLRGWQGGVTNLYGFCTDFGYPTRGSQCARRLPPKPASERTKAVYP